MPHDSFTGEFLHTSSVNLLGSSLSPYILDIRLVRSLSYTPHAS